MTIIYETKAYALVSKAAGEDSEHALPALLAEQNGDAPENYYIVHRLDRAAAGLLMIARSREVAAELSRQLQDGILKKSYLCVVPGVPNPPDGQMEDLLFKDKAKQKMYPVKRRRAGVKEAALRYTLLETGTPYDMPLSLVQVELETGRFHQIRCQFASRKMPLLGDHKYGSRLHCPHLALFCRTLSFYDWTEKTMRCFTAAPPMEYPWDAFRMLSEAEPASGGPSDEQMAGAMQENGTETAEGEPIPADGKQ